MSRIFITGDTHGDIDIGKLQTKRFTEQKKLTKDDYVIICGDFGLIWDGSKKERHLVKELSNRKFTTLFVDGNHENFDMLNKYPVSEWKGGKVHYITDSIIHLLRGEVYTIAGEKFFTYGGGRSIDKHYRTEGVDWWKEEDTNIDEIKNALDNLSAHNFEVDYIITHSCSIPMMVELGYTKEKELLNIFLTDIERHVVFKHWYFGHFHKDRELDNYHTVVYNKILEI